MRFRKKTVLVISSFVVLILIFTMFVLYRRSPYTYVKEDKIINYALMGSQSDFELLYSSCSESDKSVEYEITIQSGKEKTDQFFTIANRVNDYLETHPDYFLNEGYKITVSIVMNRSGAPEIVKFSNWNWDNADSDNQLMDHLGCVWVRDQSQWSGFKLSEIEDTALFENISVIIIDEGLGVDINIFRSFPNLRYLRQYRTLTEEKMIRLRELLPNCEIVTG